MDEGEDAEDPQGGGTAVASSDLLLLAPLAAMRRAVQRQASNLQNLHALLDAAPGKMACYQAPASVETALRQGNARLLNADWLLRRCGVDRKDVDAVWQLDAASLTPLPRRQDLPEEAFWPLSSLFAQDGSFSKRVVAISHVWLTPAHPDPEAKHLLQLCRVLVLLLQKHGALALFFDWASLFQEPRTAEEAEAFSRALPHMGTWYGHRQVIKVLLPTSVETPQYAERGWPFFERNTAGLLSSADTVIDLVHLKHGCKDYDDLMKFCALHRRPPPLTSRTFKQALARKQFANSADAQVLTRTYHEVFMAWMGSQSLDFSRHGWGDDEIDRFAPALKLCSALRTLDLSGNDFGDRAAERLASVLPRSRCLNRMVLTACNITPQAEIVLRKAWCASGRIAQELEMGGLADMPTTNKDDTFFYQGEFRKRRRCGHGVLHAPGAGFKYTGAFKSDHFHGHGDASWGDGSQYAGQWKKGQKSGKGEYISMGGLRYVGEWNNGQRNGVGTQEFQDGGRFEGTWKGGLCSGHGTYYFEDGSRYEGQWTLGRYNGTGLLTWADGTKERRNYRHGVLERLEEVSGDTARPVLSLRTRKDLGQVREEMLRPYVLPALEPSKHAIRREYAGEVDLTATPLKTCRF